MLNIDKKSDWPTMTVLKRAGLWRNYHRLDDTLVQQLDDAESVPEDGGGIISRGELKVRNVEGGIAITAATVTLLFRRSLETQKSLRPEWREPKPNKVIPLPSCRGWMHHNADYGRPIERRDAGAPYVPETLEPVLWNL